MIALASGDLHLSLHHAMIHMSLALFKAADETLGDPHQIEDSHVDWVAVELHHRLPPEMFVAQVGGRSIEPAISDKSYCLFCVPVEGSQQDKTVLIQPWDATDPETDQS